MKELIEWTETYIKHKDLTLKKIKSIDKKENVITVKYLDKEQTYHVIAYLNEEILKKEGIIVCLNTEDNFSFLIKKWTEISKIKNLSILFVNLNRNEKWFINPYIHNMIADPASIVQGLKAMFDTTNGTFTEPKKEKKKPELFENNDEDEE
ncbi:MAG: hypothetical protein KatS3mg002_0634 [Candidatus Woesearchaeota archaeon]|nr:MAG: hypothetical protein KatS3mg002_0634 [Candidatus Woesearchaeota archaeon]